MELRPDSYVTIQSWMRTELGLGGNELIAYALVYGFSQDGSSRFEGTASYVAEWCGITRENATRLLGRLAKRGLLNKIESRDKEGRKRCSYAAAMCRNVTRPCDETSLGHVTKRHINTLGENTRDKKAPYTPQIAQIVERLNERTGCDYRPTTAETVKAVSGRLSEGYTVEDFFAVIDSKSSEWGSDPKMRKYLTPQTLFRQSNFERYVNASKVSPRGGVDYSAYDV